MTGMKWGDYPIREGLEKITKSSKDDTTPAASAIGIVRLSTSAISSWRITTRTRHCGTTTLLFLKGLNKNGRNSSNRQQTLLYLRISRTRLVKASSTLIRCLAEVSMNLHPKCLARSRPSNAMVMTRRTRTNRMYRSCRLGVHIPSRTCLRRRWQGSSPGPWRVRLIDEKC